MSSSIFACKDYNRLFTARLISTIGDKFFAMAISWWIIDSGFKNANSLLGLVMGSATLGILFFGPMMGSFSDHFSKKKCMIWALIGGAVVVSLVLLIFPVFYRVPLLLAVFQIMLYAFEPLFETSMQSSLNHLVDERRLPQAVSLTTGIVPLAQVVGASLAGVAIAHLGITGSFLFNIATFIISIYFVWRVKTYLPIENIIKKDNKNTKRARRFEAHFKSIKEGFQFIFKDKPLFYLMLCFTTLNFLSAPIIIAIPILAKEVFNGTAILMSVFEMMDGIGIVCTMVLLLLIKRKHNRYNAIVLSVLFFGFFCLGLMIYSKTFVSLSLLLVGATSQIAHVGGCTMLQFYIPTHIQGRVFAILNGLAVVTMPLSFALVGFLSEIISIQTIILVNSILLVLLSGAFAIIPRIKINYII